MTGEIEARFRSRQQSIDDHFYKIQRRLKKTTSHRKKSKNQVLNFAVILASNYLDQIDQEVDNLEKEISELKNQKEATRKKLKRCADF